MLDAHHLHRASDITQIWTRQLITCRPCGEDALGGGLVEGCGIFEDLDVAALCFDHAEPLFVSFAGVEELDGPADIARFRARDVRPGDLDLTAYHPLGTCRIGVDPRTSVVGPDHEAHECSGLYVTDGSAVPTPLGVNPQMTIMAMALRAAEGIDARLS